MKDAESLGRIVATLLNEKGIQDEDAELSIVVTDLLQGAGEVRFMIPPEELSIAYPQKKWVYLPSLPPEDFLRDRLGIMRG